MDLKLDKARFCDEGLRILRRNREHPEAYKAWVVLYFDGSVSVHFSEKTAFEASSSDLDSLVQPIIWDNPEFLTPEGAIH